MVHHEEVWLRPYLSLGAHYFPDPPSLRPLPWCAAARAVSCGLCACSVEEHDMRVFLLSDACKKAVLKELSGMLKRHCNRLFLLLKDFEYDTRLARLSGDAHAVRSLGGTQIVACQCLVHEELLSGFPHLPLAPPHTARRLSMICVCVSACGSGRRSRRSCATCRTSCASCRTCWTRACGRSTRPWRCTSWSTWCRPCCCPHYSTTHNDSRTTPRHSSPRPRRTALTGAHARAMTSPPVKG